MNDKERIKELFSQVEQLENQRFRMWGWIIFLGLIILIMLPVVLG